MKNDHTRVLVILLGLLLSSSPAYSGPADIAKSDPKSLIDALMIPNPKYSDDGISFSYLTPMKMSATRKGLVAVIEGESDSGSYVAIWVHKAILSPAQHLERQINLTAGAFIKEFSTVTTLSNTELGESEMPVRILSRKPLGVVVKYRVFDGKESAEIVTYFYVLSFEKEIAIVYLYTNPGTEASDLACFNTILSTLQLSRDIE